MSNIPDIVKELQGLQLELHTEIARVDIISILEIFFEEPDEAVEYRDNKYTALLALSPTPDELHEAVTLHYKFDEAIQTIEDLDFQAEYPEPKPETSA